MIFSNLMVKQIQLTRQKHKESCKVSWLAKGRFGIRTLRSLYPTPEVGFATFLHQMQLVEGTI